MNIKKYINRNVILVAVAAIVVIIALLVTDSKPVKYDDDLIFEEKFEIQ